MYTVTHPATKTESIGLPADALLAAFFALHLENVSGNETSAPSTGIHTQEKFTVIRQLRTVYRDWQKTRQPSTKRQPRQHSTD